MKIFLLSLIFTLGIIFVEGFTATEKTYHFEFSESKLLRWHTKFQNVINYLDNSNLPHGEVKDVIIFLDSVRRSLAMAYLADSLDKIKPHK